jgi:hypothetical protein
MFEIKHQRRRNQRANELDASRALAKWQLVGCNASNIVIQAVVAGI